MDWLAFRYANSGGHKCLRNAVDPYVQGEHVWNQVSKVTGDCLCLAAAANEWCGRIQRLFFLNEGFDLTR